MEPDAETKWTVVLHDTGENFFVKEANLVFLESPTHGPLYKVLKRTFCDHWKAANGSTVRLLVRRLAGCGNRRAKMQRSEGPLVDLEGNGYFNATAVNVQTPKQNTRCFGKHRTAAAPAAVTPLTSCTLPLRAHARPS